MIDTIVRYLHDAGVPFRLASYPYEDFARLEQPRIAAIAFGGELPASTARKAG